MEEIKVLILLIKASYCHENDHIAFCPALTLLRAGLEVQMSYRTDKFVTTFLGSYDKILEQNLTQCTVPTWFILHHPTVSC